MTNHKVIFSETQNVFLEKNTNHPFAHCSEEIL